MKNNTIIMICCLFFMGCTTTIKNDPSIDIWPIPPYPKMKPVEIQPIEDITNTINGMFLSTEYAINLADNVDAIKDYSKKLEILINTMSKYYGFKINKEENTKIEKPR